MGFPSVCYCVILPQPLILVLQLLDLLRHAVLLGLSSLGLAAPPPPDDHPAAYYNNNNNAADLWALHHPPAPPPPPHAQQQQQPAAAAATVKALLPAVRYADLLLRSSSSSPSRRASAATCCAVCLGALEARHRVRELGNCAHAFHKACIDKWVDKGHHTCPLCRAPLLPDQLASSSSGSSSFSF